MKLKIVFSEPPHEKHQEQVNENERLVIIPSPYKITQEAIGAERDIERTDGTKITYEVYCVEISKLIAERIHASRLAEYGPYDDLIIEGFQQPPNFKALCSTLENTSISYAQNCQLTSKNCSVGGSLMVNSISKLIRSAQSKENICFKITLDEADMSKLSKHDEARLATLKGVTFFRTPDSAASIRPFTDDTRLGLKSNPLLDKFENPTYYYRKLFQDIPPSPESILKNFFSQANQQQNDYTCGPATVKMLATYYTTIQRRQFCGEPLLKHHVWQEIKTNPELELATKMSTTEAVGTGIEEMRAGLMEKGLTVLDDHGIYANECTASELQQHKELLWDKMQEILKLGIPVILNMHDKTGCSHFEVIIGIEKTAEEERIILAEPGTALVGALEFETIPKNDFIERWKNMSGELHGRFLILPPNAAATKAIESILDGVPHCMNGEDKNRAPSTFIP